MDTFLDLIWYWALQVVLEGESQSSEALRPGALMRLGVKCVLCVVGEHVKGGMVT